MDKRSIALLLAAITVAMLGLLAIQVAWTRNTIALREDQFDEAVSHALMRVSDRLEGIERMRELKRHRQGRRMLLRLDSMRRAQPVPQSTDDPFAGAEPVPPPDAPLEPLPQPPGFPGDDERAEHEEMVTDLVRAILASELGRDIRKRVDPVTLDSLLRAELLPLGLQGDPAWAVFTAEGALALAPAADSAALLLRASPHRARLFRHDLAGAPHYLHVRAEHGRAALLKGSWPMLIASALFLLIIALVFTYTLRAVVRQKRLNDIRNDLVNNLTHELKTPISTIGLACEALADPSIPRTERQVRAYTTMIRDENKRLGALVENVLQSAVQDGGRMVVKPVDLDLHAVIQDVVRSSTMQVSRRNGRIEADLRAEIHRVQGDRIHLTNLLYNLIDNAVKYCEQEPRIRIATHSDDEGITLSVADNGIGIAPSEQRKIFDKLYRIPTGNLHNAKGFGLGLSYVKSVVERHGGRIRVESTPGQGSTFHIFLPFAHEHQRTAPRR